MALQPMHPGFRHIEWTHALRSRWLLVSLAVMAVLVLGVVMFVAVQPVQAPPAAPAGASLRVNAPSAAIAPASAAVLLLSSAPVGFRTRIPYRPRLAGSAPDAADRTVQRYLRLK